MTKINVLKTGCRSALTAIAMNFQAEKNALHYLAYLDDAAGIRGLVAQGANVDVQNERGDTPLHVACRKRRSDAQVALVQLGARRDIRNNQGKTALDLLDAPRRWTLAQT